MALIRAGVLLRDQGKHHGRQSQLKFGQRIVNGLVMASKREHRVMVSINQMWEQGLSLRQIAKNLSAMGIPTKCNGKKWHPEMVRRIIENYRKNT